MTDTAGPLLPRVERVDGALILSVRATPGAARNGLGGVHDGALKVSVTAAPERGKANQAIVRVLAKALGLRRSQVGLVSGETDRSKRFRLLEVTESELLDKLRACCR